MANKGSLNAHERADHEGIKFPCGQCEHQATTKGDLARHRDQRDWFFTLETDTETFSSLVSSSRLRPRLKFLESRDRVFDETFFLTFSRPRLNFSYFRDRDLDESQNRDFSRPRPRLFHYDF